MRIFGIAYFSIVADSRDFLCNTQKVARIEKARSEKFIVQLFVGRAFCLANGDSTF
jgi:hypothetical protein